MLKTYELYFEDNKFGCFRVSLVKDPAVQATLVKFTDEQQSKPIYFQDEEKRVIYSVAMRPNKLIFRKNVSQIPGVVEPGNVFYTAETVEKLQINYFRKNGNSATNINHEDQNTDGVFPFESWIVKDKETDKSKLLGMDVENGDWVMGFKIDNDEVWNECKSGKLDGLSIEAFLAYKEPSINFNNEQMTKPQQLWTMLAAFFAADAESKEIAPGMFATSTEAGTIVSDKDGNPVLSGEFEIDGKKYKTDDKGAILADVKAEDEKTDPPADLTLEEAKAKIADLEAKVATIEKEKSDAEAEKAKAETELTTMTAEKATIETNLTKMTAEKASTVEAFEKFKKENTPAKKIENQPIEMTEEIPYEKMSNFQKMKFNRDGKL